ncbi:MAG: biotin transporter BioY [Myxococcales bacterium]|nr:biotin transporter BioY [Myxococcales bacterium]
MGARGDNSPGRLAAVAVGGALACAALARVTLDVPGSPVPVSLQTLAVIGSAYVAGGLGGLLAMGLYLGAAAAGAPVLADGAGGMAALTGPSAGYLAGFLAAPLVAHGLSESARDWPRPLGVALGAGLAHVAILALGAAWLVGGFGAGSQQAIDQGVVPFLAGGAMKTGVIALGVWALEAALHKG